jgi:hypothetical protein
VLSIASNEKVGSRQERGSEHVLVLLRQWRGKLKNGRSMKFEDTN